jgi:secondary thiamine-phosphate synthase enzyme
VKLLRHRIEFATSAPIEFVDVTAEVREWVAQSGVMNGLLSAISLHTTARLTLNEFDPALQRDMVEFLERLAPAKAPYAHNEHTVDDRDNAHAHLLSLLVNASETIPVADGDLMLGAWQSLFFVELDGPRAARQVELQLICAD